MSLTLALASDHGALSLRKVLISHLTTYYPQFTVLDLGTHSEDSVDYPDFADVVCRSILSGQAQLGILCCGTGIGISIRANRYNGIRAALVYDEFSATMAKVHNNANVLCFGGRTTSDTQATLYLDCWLKADFEGGRHQNRLDKLDLPTSF